MPDKTPLSPELFQFTSEELIMASPEVLEVLMQNGTIISSPISGISSSSSTPAPSAQSTEINSVIDVPIEASTAQIEG
jgi:hypothetical protein